MEVSIPFLTFKEKEKIFPIVYNNFKNAIILAKFYLWSGYLPGFSIKNFYDLKKKQFYYTKDLYEQFFLFIKKILGEPLKKISEKPVKIQNNFWLKGKRLVDLVKKVNARILREKVDYDISNLNKLFDFHLNLKKCLLNNKLFTEMKKEFFFMNYVKSIKFFPMFQHFGLGQYFLYFFPADMNEIDFKLLLSNTFQKIKYPTCIENSNSLFIKYIIPHNVPHKKYLHWLTKSKRVIREYFGFFIKKIYQVLHFENNLSRNGWIYNKDRFKMHMQNILFNFGYKFQNSGIKEFNIGDIAISTYHGPDYPEFKSLSQIFNWCSIDIKSYLGTKKLSTINLINSLLKKNLIFPYLSLKNLDLHEKVYIIIPNVKQELNKTLVKIFSFFNLVFIYEIEGEYFIHGFDKEVKFPNGLMIKIYFPKCELHEFERLFDLLFEYLEIKDYLILNDLVDGKNLIKSIYGGLGFLKSYNPLKNLEWNKQEKRWMNPKVFTSKFEPIYPDLIPKDKQ